MKKELFNRGFVGIFVGLALEQIMTIFYSLALGKGNYIAVTPKFAEAMGSELKAVLLQTVLFVIYGIVIGMAGLVLGYGKWSIIKQAGVYVSIFSAVWIPLAYVCHWIKHSIIGVFSCLVAMAVVFISIWALLYITWKIKIRKMNDCIKKRNEEKSVAPND